MIYLGNFAGLMFPDFAEYPSSTIKIVASTTKLWDNLRPQKWLPWGYCQQNKVPSGKNHPICATFKETIENCTSL